MCLSPVAEVAEGGLWVLDDWKMVEHVCRRCPVPILAGRCEKPKGCSVDE